ncbi:hypothetical protein PAAG_11495 [Paracoccidioides lutzii Pb01]|uniref:Uncharacterized protein n=1 Tax=Paracoccidioides lutzii (strain ATCC MYA-826 / Pb01) TaxID=502779 RepID=A0A0A2V2S1_PARBA|nr:hypothetical protein PAAG_11495 [Paracoccidioides lutzii Pb01]KGQ01773.1 hypothetical protein PAAG_11495 [Paracoccidioides lutzii Pb01]
MPAKPTTQIMDLLGGCTSKEACPWSLTVSRTRSDLPSIMTRIIITLSAASVESRSSGKLLKGGRVRIVQGEVELDWKTLGYEGRREIT